MKGESENFDCSTISFEEWVNFFFDRDLSYPNDRDVVHYYINIPNTHIADLQKLG